MKISLSLLASAMGNRSRTEEDLATIVYAHSMIRSAPLTETYSKSLRSVGSFSLDTLRALESERGVLDAAEIAAIARNMTDPHSRGNARAVCASEFPEFDGRCNHESNAGQPLNHYGRILPADYCGSSGAPRCSAAGGALPNPRDLSLYLKRNANAQKNDKTTHFLNVAGQRRAQNTFITHTLIQTPDRSSSTRCGCAFSNDCINWDVSDDPVFAGVPCMFVTRSAVTLVDQNGEIVPEQLNQLTGTIQAGNIYGFSELHATALRLPGSPFLEVQDHTHGIYIPSTAQIDAKDAEFQQFTKRFRLPNGLNERRYQPMFSGDNRVLENPILGSWHTLYHRLHNILAQEITEADSSLDMDFVFNEARKYNIAIMQKMVYEEMVPAIFGNALDQFDNGSLRPSSSPIDQSTDRTGPVIFNEFAAAAFRYGHSQQPQTIVTKDNRYRENTADPLQDNYFDPHVLIQEGPSAICRGASTTQGFATGPSFGDSVLHNLFKPATGDFGIDLFAINIARGRDHGLAPYTQYKQEFRLDPECRDLYVGWDGMRPEWTQMIRDMYRGNNHDVDLYIGLLMEQHVSGGSLGPTGICILGKQFKTLKTQDRWFYENREFWNNDAKFEQVKKLDLATIMCLAFGDTDKVPDMPFIADGFRLDGKTRRMVSCDGLRRRLDMSELYGEPETTTELQTTEPPTTEPGTTEPGTTEPAATEPATDEPTEAPTEAPTERPKEEPICDFDPEERIIDCSNRRFDSVSLELMATRLHITHAYPVDVRVHGGVERRQVKSDAVRTIRFSNNAGLKESDKATFFRAMREFHFCRVLDITNTNLNISKAEIRQNLKQIKQSFV